MTAVLERAQTPPEMAPTPPADDRPTDRSRLMRWSPFALTGLLISTAVLYLWNLLNRKGFSDSDFVLCRHLCQKERKELTSDFLL